MLAMFMVILIFLIILSSDAFAFQVSPATVTQTEQEQTHNFLIRVDNPGMVDVSFEGTLTSYAQANTTYVESQATIPITLSLPELAPGRHELLVVFEKAISSGEVGANAQVAPKILYVQEYEGDYIESIANVRQNTQPLEIVTIHENLGTQTGTANVFLKLEEEIIEDQILVENLQRKDYTINHEKGEYQLTTTLNNGTENVTRTQTVEIGNPVIALDGFNTTMGEIAVIDIKFDSDWNVLHEEELRTTINGEKLEPTTIILPGTAQVFWENPEEGNATVTFTIGEQKITQEMHFEEERILSETSSLLLILLITAILIGIALLFKNKERFK